MEWIALLLGFTGSLHCFGMCSPLAMSVTRMSPSAFTGRVFYNAGRIITYGALGSLTASFGLMLPFLRYQNLVSILLGIALVVIGLTRVPVHVPFVTKVLSNISSFVKNLFSQALKRKGYSSIFLLGALNGILPCGLSFLAITYCITLAGPVDGFLFMVWFGAGTLPVMLGFTGIFQWAIQRLHFRPSNIATGMLIFSGMFLIIRVFIVHIPHAQSVSEGIRDIVLCR